MARQKIGGFLPLVLALGIIPIALENKTADLVFSLFVEGRDKAWPTSLL